MHHIMQEQDIFSLSLSYSNAIPVQQILLYPDSSKLIVHSQMICYFQFSYNCQLVTNSEFCSKVLDLHVSSIILRISFDIDKILHLRHKLKRFVCTHTYFDVGNGQQLQGLNKVPICAVHTNSKMCQTSQVLNKLQQSLHDPWARHGRHGELLL